MKVLPKHGIIDEYFEGVKAAHSLLYLVNPKIALIEARTELFDLVKLILSGVSTRSMDNLKIKAEFFQSVSVAPFIKGRLRERGRA